jgi:hypothetical protein
MILLLRKALYFSSPYFSKIKAYKTDENKVKSHCIYLGKERREIYPLAELERIRTGGNNMSVLKGHGAIKINVATWKNWLAGEITTSDQVIKSNLSWSCN